jgi:ankyrin repeat protein
MLGAEVDHVDDNCRTPLEYASSYIQWGSTTSQGFFRPQCCEMLLKLGANPNRLNPEGLVPLNMAGPDADLIRVLLRHGADVNAGTKGVLMSAVEAGDVDTLKVYLEHGADCNVADTSEDSSYENRNWKSGSISKRYPILKAAQPPSYSGWDSATAAKMISLLLKHGAKVDLPISDDDTLVHYLFQRVPTSILRSFLDRPGIDVNTRDQRGRTVFMAACESHVEDEGCSSALFIPTEEQNRLRAEYIPAYMALADSELYGDSIDYLATDNKGNNVIRYLMSRWNEKVAARFLPITGVRALILQKDSAGFSPLHCALKSLKIKTCFQFIDEGNADLLEPDPNGDSALHHLYRCHYMSSHQNMYPLMKRYVSIGGDINARNKTGETALHCLLANSNRSLRWNETELDNNFDPFQFFISHGTNFQATKNDGGTALHVVAQRKISDSSYLFHGSKDDEDTNASLFRRLVDLGCDPLQEDKNGRTALDVAAAVGNVEILKLYQRKKT